MIADLDETLRALLIEEIPIKNGEIDISFDQPKREWSSRISRPTLNLFLYDVRENPSLRQHGWERLDKGGNGAARLKRTPYRVNCSYIITSWAADPMDEHRLLTRCMLALFRFPVLPEDRLLGSLKEPKFDITARLAVHDQLTNPAEVWGSLDNEIRPSVPYIITLALDPWSEVTGPLVSTFTLRSGQAESLPRRTGLLEGEQAIEMNFIGGTVRRKQGADPVPEIQVGLSGSGLVASTDEFGRFRLGSMPAGKYTLVVWPKEGKPVEKDISVPGSEEGYDIEI